MRYETVLWYSKNHRVSSCYLITSKFAKAWGVGEGEGNSTHFVGRRRLLQLPSYRVGSGSSENLLKIQLWWFKNRSFRNTILIWGEWRGLTGETFSPVSIEDCPLPKRRESSKPGSPQNFHCPHRLHVWEGSRPCHVAGRKGVQETREKSLEFWKIKEFGQVLAKICKIWQNGCIFGRTARGSRTFYVGMGVKVHLGVPKSVLGGECVYLQAGGNSGHEVSNLILPANAE